MVVGSGAFISLSFSRFSPARALVSPPQHTCRETLSLSLSRVRSLVEPMGRCCWEASGFYVMLCPPSHFSRLFVRSVSCGLFQVGRGVVGVC
jgi:hypothetical protein